MLNGQYFSIPQVEQNGAALSFAVKEDGHVLSEGFEKRHESYLKLLGINNNCAIILNNHRLEVGGFEIAD